MVRNLNVFIFFFPINFVHKLKLEVPLKLLMVVGLY